ncbi:CGNR zinc finger domain-containing protein [Nonomuraea rubra]|uniref:Putative RNA-binding Zn ribbon-like protein n=1 Tax=Nonomuraea rubra TaxID=46180 RepID=A0A7X0U2H1_9ACTN|nr:CGNR zinc finger domain-containing protein [Nonomuraea rubra]MBB6552628.1 putative RNA-binding Zn ribbon-like protein [Nonomuraea rubra]
MEVAHLTGGGAPLLGEPPPIELGNTSYAVRGRAREGLESAEHLAAWLRDVRPHLAVTLADADLHDVTDGDLHAARELRDVIRSLAAATMDGREPDPATVATLNHHASLTPRWRELRTAPEPGMTVCSAGRPVAAALAWLAEEAVALFAGPLRHDLRACHGPGCVLYFVRESPRREWCSPGCGNRARAARHYAKVRQGPQIS